MTAPTETYIDADGGIVARWDHPDGTSTLTQTYPDELFVSRREDVGASFGRPKHFRFEVVR